MADFPTSPTKSPDPVIGYPVETTGYAVPCEEELGQTVTYPDLHRRINVDQGLYTFTITIYGKPILKDKFENDLTIPDIATSESIIKEFITNVYDVQIVNVGEYVKDYIDSYIVEGYEVNFVWIVRSEDLSLQYAEGYNLNNIIDLVYRSTEADNHPVLQPDTLDYHVSAKIEREQLLKKDTYQLYVSTCNSFRTTQYYTYDSDLDQEIP